MNNQNKSKFEVLWQTFYSDITLEKDFTIESNGGSFKLDFYHPQTRIAVIIEQQNFDNQAWLTRISDDRVVAATGMGIYVYRLSKELINERFLKEMALEIESRLTF